MLSSNWCMHFLILSRLFLLLVLPSINTMIIFSIRFFVLLASLLLHTTLTWKSTNGFIGSKLPVSSPRTTTIQISRTTTTTTTSTLWQDPQSAAEASSDEQQLQPAPVLNGKRVLPFKVMSNGLKGYDNDIAAVYAVLNSNYKRGSDGWNCCEYINVSLDIKTSLQNHVEEFGTKKIAHVRALSFTFPEPNAMVEIVNQWRSMAQEAGGPLSLKSTQEEASATTTSNIYPEDYLYDMDDDDDDDDGYYDDYDDEEEDESTVVSPFEEEKSEGSSSTEGSLEFTKENVNKVLDEVRPYLISDGGNVSVEDVDAEKRNIILKLEGACGSCPSSTVTMQMGIERVLKENFADINEVIAIGDGDDDDKPTELTLEAVQQEVGRLSPAMLAMGAFVRIIGVDPSLGVVKLEFRGSNKVRQGLELAVLDIEFVNHVEFTMGD